MRSDIAQPTTRREYRSSRTARYNQPSVVAMYVMSPARTRVSTVENGGPWAYFECASFEPRWDAFADDCVPHSNKLTPAFAHVWFPVDSGSQFEKQCSQKQEDEWRTSVISKTWNATRTNST